MNITEYRALAAEDNLIRDAVARAAGPGLLALIESGQRLNNPYGISRRSMNDCEVFDLVSIIANYRHLMRDQDTDEYDRATAALACGHGYTLMDSCPGCGDHHDPYPGCLPLIALHPVSEKEGTDDDA